MKNLLRTSLVLLSLALATSCAANKNAAPQPLLNTVCLVSGEALEAGNPTADYMGGKIGFCCKDCIAKWNALDAAGKKAAFDARTKK